MNFNQILYKISNLRYNIRKKEVEYTTAVAINDQNNMDINNAALTLLKEDLDLSVKTFNSIPAHNPNNRFKSLMAKLFRIETPFHRK